MPLVGRIQANARETLFGHWCPTESVVTDLHDQWPAYGASNLGWVPALGVPSLCARDARRIIRRSASTLSSLRGSVCEERSSSLQNGAGLGEMRSLDEAIRTPTASVITIDEKDDGNELAGESYLTARHPDVCHAKQVLWYVATDEDTAK
jgi:hypothetical protein